MKVDTRPQDLCPPRSRRQRAAPCYAGAVDRGSRAPRTGLTQWCDGLGEAWDSMLDACIRLPHFYSDNGWRDGVIPISDVPQLRGRTGGSVPPRVVRPFLGTKPWRQHQTGSCTNQGPAQDWTLGSPFFKPRSQVWEPGWRNPDIQDQLLDPGYRTPDRGRRGEIEGI